MVLEEPGPVFALNGGSVSALGVFVGTAPETLPEFAPFDYSAVLFRLSLGRSAEESCSVREGLLLSTVVVLHDLLLVSPEVFLVMDGGSESKGGLDNGLEETAAATAQIVFWFWCDSRRLRLQCKCSENAELVDHEQVCRFVSIIIADIFVGLSRGDSRMGVGLTDSNGVRQPICPVARCRWILGARNNLATDRHELISKV